MPAQSYIEKGKSHKYIVSMRLTFKTMNDFHEAARTYLKRYAKDCENGTFILHDRPRLEPGKDGKVAINFKLGCSGNTHDDIRSHVLFNDDLNDDGSKNYRSGLDVADSHLDIKFLEQPERPQAQYPRSL